MSVWTGELSVGNRAIDNGHKGLHDMLDGALSLAAASGAAALAGAMEEFEKRLSDCFALEERIAQALDFDFSEHREAHQRLLDNVRRVKVEAMTGLLRKDEDYVRRLADCLTRHIRVESRPLKILLETHLYDFAP